MLLRASQPFSYTDSAGTPRVVGVGNIFDSDDPCVKGRESLFEEIASDAARNARVEDATAEPGSLRRTGGRRRTRSGMPLVQPVSPVQPAENESNTQGNA